jgi:hypothetical protein
MTSGFSTLDLVIDSKGNPRVVYAMNTSADGVWPSQSARTAIGSGNRNRQSHNNIFFNYSNDGGSSWLPANSAVVVNDTTTIGQGTGSTFAVYPGRNTAFPRMAITTVDDIYIVYERTIHGNSFAAGNKPDIILAKMAADSLKLGSAQPVRIGASGTVGSFGGIRISPANSIDVTPDIAVGDDDILHVVWYTSGSDAVQHKQMPADNWDDRSSFGWDPGASGVTVGSFDDEVATNLGIVTNAVDNHVINGQVHLFPTVVVDKGRTPDRVYTFWKHTDAAGVATGEDENIAYAISDYNGQAGAGASWGTTNFAFPTGTSAAAGPLFQAGTAYNIESHWQYVDRVAVVVDGRKPNGADIHIAFSGGVSVGRTSFTTRDARFNPTSNSIYYTRFNGNEWELPQVVASQYNGSQDGFRATSIAGTAISAHSAVFSPDIAMRDGDDNVYLAFVGGSPTAGGGVNLRNVTVSPQAGRGHSAGGQGNISPLPYFKIIGRVVTFDDVSIPNGANVYRMKYDPVAPQIGPPLLRNMVRVMAAGNTDGSGIGASTPGGSAAPGGFLTGQWMRIHNSSLGVASLTPGRQVPPSRVPSVRPRRRMTTASGRASSTMTGPTVLQSGGTRVTRTICC